MGNSKLANGCQVASSPAPLAAASNGILGQVPGHIIAQASQHLSAPDPFGPVHTEVEIDAYHLGLVRLFFELKKVRHHKHSHWIWSAYRAEPVHGGWDSDTRQT